MLVQPIDGPDVELYLNTGNGHGSTNTKIRRYTTPQKNTLGGYASYLDSAANGMSVTILIPGVYSISVGDFATGGAMQSGVSVNSAVLTTNIATVTYAQGKRCICISSLANEVVGVTCTLRLAANDIVRAHTDGPATGGTDSNTFFQLIRVGP